MCKFCTFPGDEDLKEKNIYLYESTSYADKSKYYELDIERPTGFIPERWRNRPLTVYYCPLCGRKLE
mgnify:CR=1 FL=1